VGPETIYLSPAPLYHAAPLRFTMTTMRLGGTVVVMEHFDAEQLPATRRRSTRITHCAAGADDVRADAEAAAARRVRAYDLSSLKVAIHAAAPCPVPVKEQMIAVVGAADL
jgi:acyl-CoA synthetase (AMP-forming)/AMP-acid ligase II